MDKAKQTKAESLQEWKSQMADFLLERAQKFGDITLHIKAADLIGMKEVIRRKIIKGLPLWEVDRVWLKIISNNRKYGKDQNQACRIRFVGSGGIPNAERDVCRGYKFGLFASEYEALHEEQQRVRRGTGHGP